MDNHRILEFSQLPIAAALLFGLAFLALVAFLRKPPTRSLPPGPPAWPFIGHLHLLGTFPHKDLLRQATRYGPIMYLRLGSVGTVVASSADIAREFLKTHDSVFASRPKSLAAKLIGYNGRNLSLAPYGTRWRDLRKLCMVQLFSPTRLDSFKSIREDAIVSTLHSIVQDSEQGKFEDVSVTMSTLATNVMTMMTLSTKLRTNDVTEFRELLTEASTLIGSFIIGDYIPYLRWLDLQGYERRMKAVYNKLDAFCQRTIEEHRKKRKENAGNNMRGFLDVLLQNQSSNQEQLADDTIKAVMLDVIAAGTDTSAVTLEWAMAELIRNPQILEKVRAEIDAVVGRGRRVKESDIGELKFLQAVVKETLRLHTVAPLLLPHESTEACEVAGYHIPKQTRLVVNAWAIARDGGVWEAAEEFDPGRFMGRNKEMDVGMGGLDVGVIPFGAGRRSCPAYALGLRMVNTTLATLIQCFDWELPPREQDDREQLDMSEAFAIVLRKALPLKLRFIPRLPKHLITSLN